MQAIELGGGSQRQITRNACPQDTHTTMSYQSWDDTEPLQQLFLDYLDSLNDCLARSEPQNYRESSSRREDKS